jgi:hypothetical protein
VPHVIHLWMAKNTINVKEGDKTVVTKDWEGEE